MKRLAQAWICVCVALGGCAPTKPAPPPPVASPTPAGPQTYPLTGTVRAVETAEKSVTIAHEDIPGLMGAMTMPLSVADVALLDDVRPGDEVEGKLEVVRDAQGAVSEYRLVDLVVTRPVPITFRLEAAGPAAQRLKPGDPVPDFALTTEDGAPLKLSDLRGKIVVLTFIYTRCPLPDFCPAMDRKFGELSRLLANVPDRAEKVRLLSVSFDPEHDTPDVLARHARAKGAVKPLWTYAVATHPELAKVAAPLGLTYGPRPGEIIHDLCTAVIDADGRLIRLDAGKDGKTWTPEDYARAIARALKSEPSSKP